MSRFGAFDSYRIKAPAGPETPRRPPCVSCRAAGGARVTPRPQRSCRKHIMALEISAVAEGVAAYLAPLWIEARASARRPTCETSSATILVKLVWNLLHAQTSRDV